LLLGEIQGNRVLDAGCGPGIYAGLLVVKGAEVVAFDASERMVRLAKERLVAKLRSSEHIWRIR
jgi:2-polyprenyl-3-methyl-5-hydroxy-6-metoxy-1,4-benzoquinol methylase